MDKLKKIIAESFDSDWVKLIDNGHGRDQWDMENISENDISEFAEDVINEFNKENKIQEIFRIKITGPSKMSKEWTWESSECFTSLELAQKFVVNEALPKHRERYKKFRNGFELQAGDFFGFKIFDFEKESQFKIEYEKLKLYNY